jgi:hypothetical protein
VERRERFELGDLLAHRSVDDSRLAEARAAVDDAVRDRLDEIGFDVCKRLEPRRRPVLGDEVQLQARGARIDD